ncbi:MAG: glucosyltransferase domain-containing protein [Legionella sp.]|jgi:hypothetical protein
MSKSNIVVLLYEDVRQFVTENKTQLITLFFLTILAYGYFITNWSISIDSELQSFETGFTSSISSLYQGRFLLYVINLVTNHHIIPFWNDFISVVLIFTSALVWCVSLAKINANYRGLIIFSLIYIISPIYVFYLRFTTYNISISLSLLVNSIAIYCFVHFLLAIEQNNRKKLNLVFIVLFVFMNVSTYEVFASYWVTSVLLVTTYWVMSKATVSNWNYLHKWFKQTAYGIFCLILAVILNRTCLFILDHFIVRSEYTDNFIKWGKEDLLTIYHNFINVFNQMIFEQGYNFFITVTLISCILFYVYLLKRSLRNLPKIFLLCGFVVSAFLMCFVLGCVMPLRTLQSIPLVLAGSWLIMYETVENKVVQKIIYSLVLLSTLLNAQYITRLFYGDNMRTQYDINYANQLYGFVLAKVGDAINYKPLIIIGSHSHAAKPFLIKSADTLGYSFFEWSVNNNRRIPIFMSWLGNEYITPTQEQFLSGYEIARTMTDYPDSASLKVTNKLIILRLSKPWPEVFKEAVLDYDKFTLIDSGAVSTTIDFFNDTEDKIQLNGWSYFKMQNNQRTRKYIKLISDKNSYIYEANLIVRNDVAKAFKDGSNLKFSGYEILINKKNMKPDSYRISIIVTNDKSYSEYNTNKTIDVK